MYVQRCVNFRKICLFFVLNMYLIFDRLKEGKLQIKLQHTRKEMVLENVGYLVLGKLQNVSFH